MSEEGKDEVGVIEPDAQGNHPETISWEQYVRTKETIGGKLTAERAKVTSLEEQLKTAISTEEHEKVKGELEEAKAKLQTTDTELKANLEKTLTEKRSTLITKGIPEDKVKEMSDKELDAAFVVLEHNKPGADMGSGGGSGSLEGLHPMETARRAYTK